MPGRQYSAATSYRYGFNGKENDNEVKGEGTQQDYGMRIYDPRLGRFLSVDPLTNDFPYYTPYQFAGNKPIWAIDLDGAEDRAYLVQIMLDSKNTKIEIINVIDVWTQSVNNGPAERRPQGEKGPGVAITYEIFYWQDNSTRTKYVEDFLPPKKSGLKKFLEWADNLAKGKGGGHQSGGISLMKESTDETTDANTDASGVSADFADVMHDADAFIHFLGLAAPARGLGGEMVSPNTSLPEKIQAALDGIANASELGHTIGEQNNVLNKENENSNSTPGSNSNSIKPKKVEITVKRKKNPLSGSRTQVVHTSGNDLIPDTLINIIYIDEKPKKEMNDSTNNSPKKKDP